MTVGTGREAEDQRRAKRISYFTEVACEEASARRFNTRISDLSTTGAFVEPVNDFPEGTKLMLRFSLKSVELSLPGEVRYSIPPFGMGIRFLNLAPEQIALIESVVVEPSS